MGSFALAEAFSIFPLPAYKISKAALNALTIQWAQALSSEGFVVTSINPGVSGDPAVVFTVLMRKKSVKTSMGGGDGADLTLEQGARGILEALVKSGPEKNGKFFMVEVPGWEKAKGLHQYDGAIVAW